MMSEWFVSIMQLLILWLAILVHDWACDRKYINTITRIGEFLFLTKTDSFTHCSRRILNPHDLSYVHEDRLVCRIFAWNSSSSKFPISRETWLQLIICSYQFRFRNSREASIRKQINFLKFVRRNYCQQILFKFCCRDTLIMIFHSILLESNLKIL